MKRYPAATSPMAASLPKVRRVIPLFAAFSEAIIDVDPGRCCPVPSLLTLRQWPRSYACTGDTSCPFDSFDEHLLEFRVVPVVLHVSQRCVIHASLAVHLGPRDGEVAIGTMDELISQVDLGGIRRISTRSLSRE